MAFVHGKETGVLVDGTDLSAYFNQMQATRTVATAPVHTFGSDNEQYISGLESGTVAMDGYYDGTAAAVDAILAATLTDDLPITAAPAGFGTLGNMAVLANTFRTSYDIGSSVDAAVSVAASTEANGGVRNGGVVVHALQARTGTFNGTSYDSGASSAFGAVAHLHVTAFSGTDVDIRLQDSADDAIWADLVAWTGVAATGATRSTATGTVNRYLRVIIDGGTFTTVTFAVAAARNRR